MTQAPVLTAVHKAMPRLRMLEAEALAKHTSFRIGGPAAMAFPASAEELTDLYRLCLELGHRPLILGAGTNVLAPDEGVDALVICTKEIGDVTDLGGGKLRAGCGVTLTKLANFARDRGLTGLEFAHGIPGTVGGGVYMNAGAYGGELCQVVTKVLALLPDGTVWEAAGEALGFGYRASAFEAKNALILEAEFQLKPGDTEEIARTMKDLAARRRASQPLDLPSAGSTFKRPAGGYAAALIDQAGLKGLSAGGAMVSEKHAGFVVNTGGATAKDVKQLMEDIQNKVLSHAGIRLEPEVRIW